MVVKARSDINCQAHLQHSQFPISSLVSYSFPHTRLDTLVHKLVELHSDQSEICAQ